MTILVIGNATVDLSFEVDCLPQPGETLLALRSAAARSAARLARLTRPTWPKWPILAGHGVDGSDSIVGPLSPAGPAALDPRRDPTLDRSSHPIDLRRANVGL